MPQLISLLERFDKICFTEQSVSFKIAASFLPKSLNFKSQLMAVTFFLLMISKFLYY